MSSIQRQLRQQLLLTLILVLGGTLVLLDYGVRQLTEHYIMTRLEHDTDSLLTALEIENGKPVLPIERQASIYQRAYSGHYFMILSDAGNLFSRSLWDLDIQAPPLPPGLDLHGQMPGPDNQSWLWHALGVELDDDDGKNIKLTIWVAEDISPLRGEMRTFRMAALGLLVLALLVLLYGQRRALITAFTRLDPLQQQLRAMRYGELNLDIEQVPDEVRPLVEEIRHLLGLLEQRVSRSRNALGNLAHDMKRPLQQLNLLAPELPDQTGKQFQHAISELQRMVERELRRARIVGVSSPGRQTRLSEELPPLLDVLNRIYPQHVLKADYPADGSLPQDRDDMLELLGNLLDNACKYGHQQVQLSVSREQADSWTIRVEDDGPGIPAEQTQHLLQRGTRLDESGSGSGLGLAICQDIVNSYGGRLQLYPASRGQGLMVEVWLPDQPTVSHS